MTIDRDTMRATVQDYVRLLMGIQRREAGRRGNARDSEVRMVIEALSEWLLDCPADSAPVTMAEFWRYEELVNAASIAFNAYVVNAVDGDKNDAIHAYHAASDQLYAARVAGDETFTAAAQQFISARDRLRTLVTRR